MKVQQIRDKDPHTPSRYAQKSTGAAAREHGQPVLPVTGQPEPLQESVEFFQEVLRYHSQLHRAHQPPERWYTRTEHGAAGCQAKYRLEITEEKG